MREILDRWFEIARWAPSGDNMQPWDVEAESRTDGTFVVSLRVDERNRKRPVTFDVESSASVLALGAFAYTLACAAKADGYFVTELSASSEKNQDAVFRLILEKGSSSRAVIQPSLDDSSWERTIRARTVNRFPYAARPLDPRILELTQSTVAKYSDDLRITPITQGLSRVGKLIFQIDILRFQHEKIYHELLDELRFGKEVDQTREGLNSKTLGVPPPAQWFMWLLRQFRFLRFLMFVGVQYSFAFLGGMVPVIRSSGVFFLTARQRRAIDWFRIGLCFQEIWLKLTEAGLSLQPIGTPLLAYRYFGERGTASGSFNEAQGRVVARYAEGFSKGYGIDMSLPCLGFRVGYGPKISQLTPRKAIRYRITPGS